MFFVKFSSKITKFLTFNRSLPKSRPRNFWPNRTKYKTVVKKFALLAPRMMMKTLLATGILSSLCMSGNDIKVANNIFAIIMGVRSINFLFFGYLLPWLTSKTQTFGILSSKNNFLQQFGWFWHQIFKKIDVKTQNYFLKSSSENAS